MKDNIIQKKSYEFALKIIQTYRFLSDNKKEFVLSRQILRSGTSIGANIEEAIGAQSGKDFISKMTVSYKEARETGYWIRLLRDSGLLKEMDAQSLLSDCEEIIKIIGKIQKTFKEKNLS